VSDLQGSWKGRLRQTDAASQRAVLEKKRVEEKGFVGWDREGAMV
jgi:hypothetical protein